MRDKNFYMKLAKMYADKSKDDKLKVGCAIITKEGIVYPGYNGDEIGGSNLRDSMKSGQSGFVHAEANAILKFNPAIHKDCAIFISHSPCVVCARMIINTQAINKVYYELVFRDTNGLDVLSKNGIITEQVAG